MRCEYDRGFCSRNRRCQIYELTLLIGGSLNEELERAHIESARSNARPERRAFSPDRARTGAREVIAIPELRNLGRTAEAERRDARSLTNKRPVFEHSGRWEGVAGVDLPCRVSNSLHGHRRQIAPGYRGFQLTLGWGQPAMKPISKSTRRRRRLTPAFVATRQASIRCLPSLVEFRL